MTLQTDKQPSRPTQSRRPKKRRSVGVVFTGVAAVGVSFFAGGALQSHLATARGVSNSMQFADRDAFSKGKPASGGEDDGPVPAATFESVYSLVKEHYVDTLPSESDLSKGALRSMLAALNDPNAMFLDADANAIFRNEAAGHYAGIGAELFVQTFDKDGYTDHKIVVVSTLPGSPAEKAGLRAHDVITHINGKWVLGSDPFLKVNRMVQKLQDANKNTDTDEIARESETARQRDSGGIGLFNAQLLLRGDAAIRRQYHVASNALNLTVLRTGATAPLAIAIPSGEIAIAPITAHTLADGGLLFKIPAFTDHTADELAAALNAGNGASAHGIVLDLRGNAGGVGAGTSALHVAARIASLFLTPSRGPATFAVEQRTGGARTTLQTEDTAKSDTLTAVPSHLVVLVDGGTAGAAEALAAALADSGGATLCGGRTFGDAIVQTVFPLPDHESAFTLVTGRLLSPRRVSWAGTGLTPKVAIAPGASEEQILGKLTTLLGDPANPAHPAHVAAISPDSPDSPSASKTQ